MGKTHGVVVMKLFISAVSSEFRVARSQIASDLRARGLMVKVQDDFRQEVGAETTLELLRNYIRQCDAVICIVGARHGALPPGVAAEKFGTMLPAGIVEASYTQWEFFFARRFQKRLSLHFANSIYQAEEAAVTEEDAAFQSAFVGYILDRGLNRTHFDTADEVRIHVLREDWPNLSGPKPIALPFVTLGPLFKGRDGSIEQLRSSLQRAGERQATAIVGKAVHGLGGVGKTRLAVEYAWKYAEDYSALLFVTADTPQAQQRNLGALCGPLVLNLPEQHLPEEDARLAAVIRWLQQNPGWLLILDNVDSTEAAIAAEKRLAHLRGGHVILTSRLSRWGGTVEAIELDVLTIEAATDFLLARTDARRRKASDDPSQAQRLAEELGQLSLALEQAGAYIAENRLTFVNYLDDWRNNHAKVLEWFDERVMQYPRSIAVTWKISVDLLSAPARQLLECLAWLAPDPIPESLLLAPGASSEPVDVRAALANLETYSLVTRAPNTLSFSVHRLVQDVTRCSLPGDGGHRALIAALHMCEAFPPDSSNPERWPTCSALLPHILAAADWAEARDIELECAALLLNRVGVYLWARSDLIQARDLHQRVLALREARSGSDHLVVAESLNNLGLVLWDLVDLAGARVAHERALAIREKWLGANHQAVAASLNNLGVALWDLAELVEARAALERALRILECQLGKHHPSVSAILNNLGAVLGDLEELTDARAAHERALRILQPRAIDDMEDINRSEGGIEDPGELAVARAVLDPPLVKQSHHEGRVKSLAIGSGGGDNNAAALALTSTGLKCSILGELRVETLSDHPAMVKILDNYGVVLTKLGQLEEAREAFEKALEIRETHLGADHPDVGWSLTNLGVTVGMLGDLPAAKTMLERGLAIREARLGSDHLDVATNLSSLGTILGAGGQLAEARATLERALASRALRLGPAHPATTTTRENLRRVLDALGSPL